MRGVGAGSVLAAALVACGAGSPSGSIASPAPAPAPAAPAGPPPVVPSPRLHLDIQGSGRVRVLQGNNFLSECTTQCTIAVAAGARLTLAAESDIDWKWSGFTGCLPAGDATCSVDMTADADVRAEFVRGVTLTIDVVVPLGSVHVTYPPLDCRSVCQVLVFPDATVELHGVPDADNEVSWADRDWTEQGNPVWVLRMGADRLVRAVFRRKFNTGDFGISVGSIGAGSGRVTSDPAGISCLDHGVACGAMFAAGTTVVLHASSSPGSKFLGWLAPCSGTADCTIGPAQITQSVSAFFALEPQKVRFALTDVSALESGGDAPAGIDEQGRIAGSIGLRDFPFHRAYFWDGQVNLLDTGDEMAFAGGISAGRVIGSVERYDDPGCSDPLTGSHFCPSRALLFADGVRTDLGSLGPGFTEALGINAAGHVVGISDDRAFFWDGQMHDLGSLSPGGSSFGQSCANAVNDADVAAGFAESPRGMRAATFANGKVTDLGVLTGGGTSMAFGINSKGTVVGWSETRNPDGSPTSHGFVFANGTMLDAGTVAPGGISALYAINDEGQAVGANSFHAVLWEDGVLTDLNALVDAPGWVITDAHAINGRGQIAAVGFAVPAGDWHALLLTPR